MIDLIRHDQTPAPWLHGIRVSAAFTDQGWLALCYRLAGQRDRLLIPDAGDPVRVEGLWRHTCFEAFVMGDDAPAYREFNFAPSGAWQAYAFRAYRQGGPLEPVLAPRSERLAEDALSLNVWLPPADLPSGARLRIGLSAVVEAMDGDLSYWALRHPPGQPDFHHSDCFDLELVRP